MEIKKEQKLLLINDRYGLRPLYYAENDGKLLFGSEVKAILADPTFDRQVNDGAIADFFAFEHIMGNKTFFQGITVLPPASVLSYRRNKLSIVQYWNFAYNEQNRSEEDIASELVTRFRKAVERRVQGNLRKGLFLSGGLDSRSVLAASDKKLYTITFGKKGCEDARIARKVADQQNVKNEFMEITGDEYPQFAEKSVFLSDGLINSYHFHAISFMDKIKDRIDVVFDGLALDLTLGGTYLKKDIFSCNQKNLPKTLFKMCNRLFTEDMAKQLFTKEYYKKIEGQAFNSFKKELEKVKEKNIANRADHFFITNHVRRFTTMSSTYIRNKIELLTPTYDNDFFEFILTIPPQLRYNHRIYRKFLKKLNKKMAKIAYQKTGIRPSAPEILWKIGFIARAANYKLKRLIKMRTNGALSIPDKLTYIQFDDWIRKKPAFREFVKKILLSEEAVEAGYFNRNYLEKLIDDHLNYRKDYSRQICALITFELWRRLFTKQHILNSENDQPKCPPKVVLSAR